MRVVETLTVEPDQNLPPTCLQIPGIVIHAAIGEPDQVASNPIAPPP